MKMFRSRLRKRIALLEAREEFFVPAIYQLTADYSKEKLRRKQLEARINGEARRAA